MAIRLRSKHDGDIGEAEVLKDFLLMGAAVNSLTGSDYGLDLHIQVPLRPLVYQQLATKWELSGRVAHAQIKNMTSGQDPSTSVGRVRGWIAGAMSGTPTFVVILKGNRRLFLSPLQIKAALRDWEKAHAGDMAKDASMKTAATDSFAPKTVTLKEESAHEFQPEAFPWLLHLWTSYPGVMMNSQLAVQDWLFTDPNELDEHGTQFIAQVLLAWMKSHYSDTTPVLSSDEIASYDHEDGTWLFERSESVAGARSILQAGFKKMYPECSSEEVERHVQGVMSMLGLAWLKERRYPLAELMTSYSTSPHSGQSLLDALRLLTDVMGFLGFCRSRGKARTGIDKDTHDADSAGAPNPR